MRVETIVLAIAILGTGACAAILGLKTEDPSHPFEHQEHARAGVHCLNCHEGVQNAKDEGDLHLPSTKACVKCHEKPHDTRDCGTCHGIASVRGGVVHAREILRFDHERHRTTTKADCVRCHADDGSGAAMLRPKMAACLSCHGHEEAFDTNDCNGCHVDLRDEGTLPEDHVIHGPSFANDHAMAAASSPTLCANCHAQQFCASCHTGEKMPLTPSRIQFDTPKSGGLHRAGFMARHAEESANNPGLCTTCHAPEGCSSCHAKKKLEATPQTPRVGDLKNPHPPGWLGPPGTSNDHGPAVWRDPASCASCHGGAGEQLCVGCHRAGAPGGNPHPPGGAPKGSRSAPPCSACHVGGR